MNKWRIRDIIDLEYFFHKDAVSQSAENQQYLNERDRNVFLNAVRPAIKKDETPDRQFMIQAWLNRRREEEAAKAAVLPGESFESLYRTFSVFLVFIGIILGAGAGLTFLTYSGERPLNVFVYLFLFVFSQILLLLMLLVFSTYRLKRGTFLTSSPLYKLISRFMLRILLSAQSRLSKKMGAEQRIRVTSILGTIKGKGLTYGLLLFLPIFILTQLFGIGFNLGLLATTFLKVITTDIAFGWQSTLQLSPAAVHALIQKIALPWSWLVSGDIAFPSLAQVEGSRIILKEGIYHLSTPDLASWWPFLCFNVLFYGLLPRLVLFLGAFAVQRRHLSSLDFRQGVYEQLLLRMTSPLVNTCGRKVDGKGAEKKEPQPDYSEKNQTAADLKSVTRNLLVMIPDDISESCTQAEVESAVKSRFGSAVEEIIRINKDYATDLQILSDLKNSSRPAETDILLIQEAWQPPIGENINFIKNLRTAVGSGPCIRIGLIGKPLSDTIFSPVKDENRKIWTPKINAIGDPCIYVVGLGNHVS